MVAENDQVAVSQPFVDNVATPALGTANAVIELLGDDAGELIPEPERLMTENVYAVPPVNPVTDIDVDVPLAVIPLGDDVTR